MGAMGAEDVVLILLGALLGGLVNGLTGFGTAITALALWLYVMSPMDAASLAIICAAISQVQTLPMIWRHIRWDLALPLVVPGLIGVPVGTILLAHTDPRLFKLGVGGFLIAYSAYVLARRRAISSAWGGKVADGVAGFGGGFLGGLAGVPGVLPVLWTDIRGWSKEHRRGVVQIFNLSVLSVAVASHAVAGMLTRHLALQTALALPGTIAGVWIGAFMYRRLADRGYQRAVMVLLLLSGLALVWTSR
jgi:uncharacterized membrane protein YfcA